MSEVKTETPPGGDAAAAVITPGAGVGPATTASTAPAPEGADDLFEEGAPVADFPLRFRWQKGDWKMLFDKHVQLIQSDIRRALVDDRVVVYLSCPISNRGGGFEVANVEIANHTQQRLLMEWGTGFWILNPAQYQMESKEGTGLIRGHARLIALETGGKVNIDVDKLPRPTGGDYMRMWTRVLVEDESPLKSLGDNFGAYYFLGPSDVRSFFTKDGTTSLTAGVEEYFARKFATDPRFREQFTVWKKGPDGKDMVGVLDADEWERRRKNFLRYYTVRASANFSKGSHDEWNIWRLLNRRRLEFAERTADKRERESFELGQQIAGYFDGRQIDPSAGEVGVSPGYALP